MLFPRGLMECSPILVAACVGVISGYHIFQPALKEQAERRARAKDPTGW